MVKGITKRVVVVRCPDAKYFEEAIFMVREDVLLGENSEEVLREACRAADGYIRENTAPRKRLVPWIAGGAAVLIGLCLLLWLV